MTQDSTSTIAALATAPAPAGIAVVRVSGPNTRTAIRAIFRSKHDPVADPRRLTYGELIDYRTGEVIDHAMAVFMPSPHSYTGEDVGEFQFHGSPGLVRKVLRSLFAYGAVPAEPGEFTKRAFLNGKIDLIQAEAISDMINATSDQSLKVASEQLHGRLSAAVARIGEPLRDVLAEIEAYLDFPEEDIDPKKLGDIADSITAARNQIEELLKSYQYGHVVKEGLRVLLCGKPNVGKSSILNMLLGKERAIVSDVSGTTRDLIEEEAVFSGYKFIFCDSAGLADSNDKVEKIGIELAKERVGWADLVLFVVDASDKSDDWRKLVEGLQGKAKKIWMITNKIDLNPTAFTKFFCDSKICAQNFYVSAKSRDGLDALVQAMVDEVSAAKSNTADSSGVVTNERHSHCLSTASEALNVALTGFSEHRPLEIISADIRSALNSLEEIVGKTYTEDVLGRIFSRFCIGK